ncbi:hypothetical protein TNCV_2191601 [Trichonephila clavipes]|nr:hypothetical protein TNCV_2191601 [Trichonephila clavipes]
MLQSSAAISLQPGLPEDMIFCSLWGYLKVIVFGALIAHLSELKSRIAQHPLKTLRSVVKHAVSRSKLVADNSGPHVDHVLYHSHKI